MSKYSFLKSIHHFEHYDLLYNKKECEKFARLIVIQIKARIILFIIEKGSSASDRRYLPLTRPKRPRLSHQQGVSLPHDIRPQLDGSLPSTVACRLQQNDPPGHNRPCAGSSLECAQEGAAHPFREGSHQVYHD